MTMPAGTFSYNYDAAGRRSSMTNPFSETTSRVYLNNDWLQSQTLANGATTNHTYNALGQVTRLLNQISGYTICDFSSIGYDGVGNRNSVTASVPTFSRQASWSVRGLIMSLIILVTLAGCERSMKVTIEGANPPTFKLAGSGRLIFFTVFEPVQGRPSIDDPKMWEIRPTDENLISKLPPITYGIVPVGFRQTIPSSGAPPALVEGKVYEAGGPAFNANGGSIRFTIKDGRAVTLPENK